MPNSNYSPNFRLLLSRGVFHQLDAMALWVRNGADSAKSAMPDAILFPSFHSTPCIKFALCGSETTLPAKIVNGNEPQRAAQAKNGEKTPENALVSGKDPGN